MKTGMWVVVALLVGLVLGAWGPRADLRKAREQINNLEKKQRAHTATASRMEGVKAMLKLPDQSAAASKPRPQAQPPKAKPTTEPRKEKKPPQRSVQITIGTGASATNKSGGLEKDLSNAYDLWTTRVELARNSFITNVGLNNEQAAVFDGLTATMNAQLESAITRWTDTLKQKDAMTSEDGVRMMNDLSGVLINAYQEMDQTMPAGWRNKAGDGFDLVNFVDPGVAMPLVEVEGKLQRRRGRDSNPLLDD